MYTVWISCGAPRGPGAVRFHENLAGRIQSDLHLLDHLYFGLKGSGATQVLKYCNDVARC